MNDVAVIDEETMVVKLKAAYEDARGKPPRGKKCRDPRWLTQKTQDALEARSAEEVATKTIEQVNAISTPESAVMDAVEEAITSSVVASIVGPHEMAEPTAETATTKLYDTTIPAGGLCLYHAAMSNLTG